MTTKAMKTKSDRHALIESVIPMAVAIAVKFTARHPYLREDAISIAYLEACRAAVYFNPARGFRFSTHAGTYMRNGLINWRRLANVKRRSRGRVPAIVPLSDRAMNVASQDTLPDAMLEAKQRAALVRRAVATAAHTPKELALADLRLLSDSPVTLREVGERFGVTRQSINRVESKLLRRVRDQLARAA